MTSTCPGLSSRTRPRRVCVFSRLATTTPDRVREPVFGHLRYGPVPTGEVPAFQVVLTAWLEVGQRVQRAGTRFSVLLDEPDLIPPEHLFTQGWMQQGRVM